MELPPAARPVAKPLAEAREIFRGILDMQIAEPNGGDVRISAFAECVRGSIGQSSYIGEFCDELLAKRPDIGPSHLFTRTLRGTQSKLYPDFPGYPLEATTPEFWQSGFDWIFDDAFRAGSFQADVWSRPLQSNVSPRYKSLKAFMHLAAQHGRLDGPPRVLDFGCSQNAGLNHIASGLPFKTPEVFVPSERQQPPSPAHSGALAALLGKDVQLDLGVGIDLTWPEDSRPWAWACSHNPSELLNEEQVALFDMLINAHFDNVKFFKGDVTQFDTAAFEREFPGKFSIVHMSTMLYQLSESQRKAAYAVAERYAEDFIVVQDFVEVDSGNPRRLHFRKNWRDGDYSYRTVVRDMRDPTRRWYDMFDWRDGRCNSMRLGRGRAALRAMARSWR